MKLVNLIPLKEIDFRNQDQFDDYVKNHELRPDTKVTIAGKVTTAGQAAKNSEPVKGTSVFGKDKGGSVFGGDKSKAKQITNDDIEGLTSYKDFDKFFKANKNKLDKNYDYILKINVTLFYWKIYMNLCFGVNIWIFMVFQK